MGLLFKKIYFYITAIPTQAKLLELDCIPMKNATAEELVVWAGGK